MELTNEQKAKIFSMYLGCKINTPTNSAITAGHLCGIKENNFAVQYLQDVYGKWHRYNVCKLLLRPLSAITDEESIEVAVICGFPAENCDAAIWVGKAIVMHFFGEYTPWDSSKYDYASNRKFVSEVHGYKVSMVKDYLKSIGIAVPLFIGSGHPYNGKTAIELGLAI